MNPATIRLTDVRAGYDERVVIDGASFTFAASRTTALIGPGGSGKSTLLKILGGSSRELPGDLWFSGHIEGVRDVAFVRQHARTSQESLASVIASATSGQACAPLLVTKVWHSVSAEINAMLQQHIDTPLSLLPAEPRKLAELTIAVASERPLLLLDEPLSGLALAGSEALRELLLAIRGTRTIIVVSHNLPFTRAVADEVVFLLDGVIVESGTTNQIFENPTHERTRSMITWGA